MKTYQTVIIINLDNDEDYRLSLSDEQVRMLHWLEENELIPETVKIYDSTEEPESI